MALLLNSSDPEPPIGLMVTDTYGIEWLHVENATGDGSYWVMPDNDADPESWVKVAGNYGPVYLDEEDAREAGYPPKPMNEPTPELIDAITKSTDHYSWNYLDIHGDTAEWDHDMNVITRNVIAAMKANGVEMLFPAPKPAARWQRDSKAIELAEEMAYTFIGKPIALNLLGHGLFETTIADCWYDPETNSYGYETRDMVNGATIKIDGCTLDELKSAVVER